jgi:MFS transporter, DHA1 family, tetracycline resistance protein
MKKPQINDSPEKAAKHKMHMALGLMFLTVFIDLVGFGIIIPVLPLYAKQFGANGLTIGLLGMSYSLMQFFFAPFWGRLSDKVGRRPVLMVSLAASAAGYLVWGFSGALWMLFLSRVVAGIGNANMAVAQAYVADVTPEEYRAQGMGMMGAAFGLGFVLGPAIGGVSSWLGVHPNTLGFIAAFFSIVDLIFTALYLPEPEVHKGKSNNVFELGAGLYFRTVFDSKLFAPLAIIFISTFAFANMEITLVLLTNKYFHFSMRENSLMFVYIGILIVLVQGGLIRRLSKKYPEKPLITIGTVLIASGLLLIPVSSGTSTLFAPMTASLGLLLVALAFLAVGSGINNPSSSSLVSKLADPTKVGGVMGVSQSLATLGRILGPIAGGFLWDTFGATGPYAVGAASMVLAFAMSLGLPLTKTLAGEQAKTAAGGEEATGADAKVEPPSPEPSMPS